MLDNPNVSPLEINRLPSLYHEGERVSRGRSERAEDRVTNADKRDLSAAARTELAAAWIDTPKTVRVSYNRHRCGTAQKAMDTSGSSRARETEAGNPGPPILKPERETIQALSRERFGASELR